MKNIKRSIFKEVVEGIESMDHHRKEKMTLKTHKVEPTKRSKVSGKLIRGLRKHLNVSQSVFAHLLQVNARTLENWEQGRSKPNSQAATLILLVHRFPDTLVRLRKLS